jgi:hypothetical protein
MPHVRHGLLATLMVAALPAVGGALAAGRVSSTTDPGFIPDAGQINRGFDPKPPSMSEYRKVPSHAEALAAKLTPASTQPALGDEQHAALPASETMRRETKDGQSTAGGPQATNAGTDTQRNGSQEGAGAKPLSATSGAASSGTAVAQAPQGSVSPGPIGAIGATMPAKFSERNDTLDRVPIMGLPLPLSEQDRKTIYQAVMADKAPAAIDADNLVPASLLSSDQYFNDTHPLPASVSHIGVIQSLAYLKTKTRVLLVEPQTRVVFGEIDS